MTTPTDALAPGTRVERYVVEHLLGDGGMARVYAVRHAVLGSQHALKVLSSRHAGLHERLLREGRAQARLDPDKVVPVQDVLSVDGAPALLMPWVRGCSLRQLLDGHTCTEAEAAALFLAVVGGVAAAHAVGIVHRDLKPANVLLDIARGQVRVRVADFGLALTPGDGDMLRTMSGVMMGTPAYAAPEQRRDAAGVDHRADLWSLGVMLAELLTGSRPSTGPDGVDMPGVPARWAPTVRALLEPDVDRRLGEADELLVRVSELAAPVPLRADEAVGRVVEAYAADVSAPPVDAADEPLTVDLSSMGSPSTPALPAERDRFLGRQAELAQIAARLEVGRLVVVTGIGGSGKTRLALRYARDHYDDWPGGVWLCDLSEAHTDAAIFRAVASALDVPLGADALPQLGHVLADRGRGLLIVDSAEPVRDEVSAALGAWLDRAEQLHVLVTSREPLRLNGQSVCRLGPLPPAVGQELFLERAAAAAPDAVWSDDDREAIVELVELLDHLPLAIELAAARAGVLSPTRLLERMGDRFRLLASVGHTSDHARHSTLSATLDGSWALLEPWEQEALRQLSVFEGGFDLEAVEAVVDLDAVGEAPWPMDVVQSLLQKSLVRRGPDGRFGLLRSVHAYVRDKADDVDAVEARHASYFARWGTDEALDALEGHGGVALRRAQGADLANLVAACVRSVRAGRAVEAGATCCAAWAHLSLSGPVAQGAELAEAVLALPTVSESMRARVELVAALAAHAMGRNDDARSLAEAARGRAHRQGDLRLEGRALRHLGQLDLQAGDLNRASISFVRALEAHRAARDLHSAADTHNRLHILRFRQGRLQQSVAHLERALALVRSLGNRHRETALLANLGVARKAEGRPEEARKHYESALEMAREVGDRIYEASLLNNLTALQVRLGDVEGAEGRYREALQVARRVGARSLQGSLLGNLGEVFRVQGDAPRAKRYLSRALVVHEEVGNPYGVFEALLQRGELLAELSDPRALESLHEALARGGGLHGGEGRALGALGALHLREGRHQEAERCFEDAERRLRDVGDPEWLAGLLCERVHQWAASGQPERARAALAEARQLAVEAGTAREPLLARKMARAASVA